MHAKTWVPAGATLLLLLGVLVTRDGTAAAEDDLLPPVADPPATVPSPGPDDDEDEDVLVEANGIEGMRLGTTGSGLEQLFDDQAAPLDGVAARPPNGCAPAHQSLVDDGTRNWDSAAWLVDGQLSAVVLTRWDPSTDTARPGVVTWLGPTLGSPVAAAQELPRARTSTHRPFGSDGPDVTVVVVPGDGVEVVFSDATYDAASLPEAAQGRITTLEVRHPRARPCSMEDLQAAYPGNITQGADAVPVSLGLDGLAAAPLGTPVEVLRGLPGIQDEGGDAGCESFYLPVAGGGTVRLVALDGVVASVQAWGPVPTELGVGSGDSLADVRAAYPQLADGGPALTTGNVEVVLADRVLGIELWPAEEWVPEVDVPVTGGPQVVAGVSVRGSGVATPSRLC